MTHKARWIAVITCLILFKYQIVLGQGIPVYDNANFIQSVITAGQTVLIVLNQIAELTGLEEIVLGEETMAEMTQLSEILQEATALGNDINTITLQLKLLFDLDTAPAGTRELQQRLAEMRRLTTLIYLDALRTETLLQSTISALRHMVRLTSAIGEFLGAKQGSQTLAQWDAKLTIELMKLRKQNALFHRAQAVDRLQEPIIQESIVIITREVMSDYPK